MKRIYLGGEKGKEKFVLVDDDVYYAVMKLDNSVTAGTGGYPRMVLNGKNIALHRYAVGLDNIPTGMDVDHANGDIYDARRSNLRICTKAQNSYNKRKPKFKNTEGTSEFLGVSKENGAYRANIGFIDDNGMRRKHSKSFRNEIDAVLYYNKKVMEIHGEYARINTVPVPSLVGVKEFEQMLEGRLKGGNK